MDIFWQILLGNLATVALVMSVWMQAHPWIEDRIPVGRDALFGVAMGLGAILSMLMAVEVQPGVYFYLRHALIAMSGLFGGPVSVIIAGIISATFRIGLAGRGSAWVFPGYWPRLFFPQPSGPSFPAASRMSKMS